MPEVEGPELARHLEAIWRDLKVIVMSAHPAELLSLDADWTFIRKPFSVSALVQAIREGTAAIAEIPFGVSSGWTASTLFESHGISGTFTGRLARFCSLAPEASRILSAGIPSLQGWQQTKQTSNCDGRL
jgi:hypothetical protein